MFYPIAHKRPLNRVTHQNSNDTISSAAPDSQALYGASGSGFCKRLPNIRRRPEITPREVSRRDLAIREARQGFVELVAGVLQADDEGLGLFEFLEFHVGDGDALFAVLHDDFDGVAVGGGVGFFELLLDRPLVLIDAELNPLRP